MKQIPESQQGCYRKDRSFDDLHAPTKVFIQHPLRNNKLTSARKHDLYLMHAERRTLPNNGDLLSVTRMVLVMNLGSGQNIRSV